MKILSNNPIGHVLEKKLSITEPGSGSDSFRDTLESKFINPSPVLCKDGLIKGMKLFGKAAGQALSERDRIIMQAKGQEAIRWLARRFGIPEGFMNLILQQLGIDAEALANPETKDIALKAIMEYFELSEDEQKSLIEDFNFFMEGLDF